MDYECGYHKKRSGFFDFEQEGTKKQSMNLKFNKKRVYLNKGCRMLFFQSIWLHKIPKYRAITKLFGYTIK